MGKKTVKKRAENIVCFLILIAFFFVQIFPANGLAELVEGDLATVSGNATGSTDPNNANIFNINNEGQSIMEGVFNISPTQIVNVYQSESSQLLIRDTSGQVSDIYGFLNIFEGLFILNNTAGINNAGTVTVMNGADFIASTLNIQSADFLSGQFNFEQMNPADFSKIINTGTLTAQGMARIVLLADAIENHGTIEVQTGHVMLAAGEKMTLDLSGNGLINLVMDQGVMDNQEQPLITNTGELHAEEGKITLTAEMLNSTLDTLINSTGIVEAGTVVIGEEGIVEIRANGAIDIMSTLEAADVTVAALGDSQLGSIRAANLEVSSFDAAESVNYDVTDDSELRLSADLTVNANAALDLTNASADVDGDVVILPDGTLMAPSGVFTVSGNWTNHGIFVHNNGTVEFDGAKNSEIDLGDDEFLYDIDGYYITGGNRRFYNLIINKDNVTDTVSLLGERVNFYYGDDTPLRVEGAMILRQGTFEQNTLDMTIGDPGYTNQNLLGREALTIEGGIFNGSNVVIDGSAASMEIRGDFRQTGGHFRATRGNTSVYGHFLRGDGGEITIDNPYYDGVPVEKMSVIAGGESYQPYSESINPPDDDGWVLGGDLNDPLYILYEHGGEDVIENPFVYEGNDSQPLEQITIKTSAGTFDANEGTISFEGTYENIYSDEGQLFPPQEGMEIQTITGSTQFHHVRWSGPYLALEAGSLIEVKGFAELTGSYLQSTLPCEKAYLALTGIELSWNDGPSYAALARRVTVTNVQDMHNLALPRFMDIDEDPSTPDVVEFEGYTCIGCRTFNWFPESYEALSCPGGNCGEEPEPEPDPEPDPEPRSGCVGDCDDDPELHPRIDPEVSEDTVAPEIEMVCESILGDKSEIEVEEAEIFLQHPDGSMELLPNPEQKNAEQQIQDARDLGAEAGHLLRCMRTNKEAKVTEQESK